MQRIRWWAETLVFPSIILGTMVPAGVLLTQGAPAWVTAFQGWAGPGLGGQLAAFAAWLLDLGYFETIVVMGTIFVSFSLQLGLQRWLPYRPDWRNWKPDLAVDLVHMFFSNGLGTSLARAAFLPLAIAGHAWVTSSFGGVPWPVDWPWVVQLALALVIGDLGIYWLHRLSHEWMPLWRLHALHHSSEHMSLLASVRIHPLQMPLNWLTQTAPLVFLGAGPEILALHTLFTAVHGQLQHANIAQRLGPLSYIFATVEAHRWHHSTDLDEGHTNYGNNILLWDHLFGTFHLPGGEPDEVGIGVSYPRNVFLHLASPWLLDRWSAPLVDESEEQVPAK
ncbi:MAG: sterol desaturase family protein [Myxococcota bacterium]